MSNQLEGKKIAFLATDGFEQVELTHPWKAIKSAGATVELVSLESGKIQGFNHLDKADQFEVDKPLSAANPSDYAGLVLPGGVANPDSLRTYSEAVNFVKAFVEQSKPVAAICHGPWTLVEADVVKGRTLTSFPSIQTDIRNAGGTWVDETVHVDQGIITSRNPDDLEAFSKTAIEEFAKV